MNRSSGTGVGDNNATSHMEAPVKDYVGTEQCPTAGVGDLEVIIAVRQTCSMRRRVQAGAPVQVNRAGGIILIAVDHSCIAVGRKDRASKPGVKRRSSGQ